MKKCLFAFLILFIFVNSYQLNKKIVSSYTKRLDNKLQSNFVLTRTSTSLKLLINNKTVNLINVPDVRQAQDYTCGPSSLQAVLMYYGIEQRQGELARRAKADPQEGASIKNLTRVAQEEGLRVTLRQNMNLNDLFAYINKKIPVIVLIQAWRQEDITPWIDDWEDGHYVVAIGYDQDHIYFEDPSILGGIGFIPISEFGERWHDEDLQDRYYHFGMIIEGKISEIQTCLYIS